jgi:S1-C subfamily serine protease
LAEPLFQQKRSLWEINTIPLPNHHIFMSSRISMWVGLIGAAATIPLVQTIAVATSQVEVAETARTITVLITYPNGQGSGVILKHEGDVYTVLTAAHVVRKKVSYKIVTHDEKEYEVISSSIVSAPGDIDLAVVTGQTHTFRNKG